MSTIKWHGGKGSQTRKVDSKKFSENWERIFGNEKQDSDGAMGTDPKKK